MTQSPRLEEVLEVAIGERLRSFYTALPAEVVSFDEGTGKATIRCRVINASEDSRGEKSWLVPTIQNVPVQFPGSGTNRITFPVSAGDKVIYLVSTLPLHEWSLKGSSNLDVDPVTFNNLVSGWIVPGISLTPPTDTPQDAVVVHAGAGVKVKVGGSSGTEPTLMADTFLDGVGALGDFLDLLTTFVTTAAGLPGMSASAGALETGITTLKGLFSTFKTTKTEVK